jgi:hypothetical protein
MATTLPRNATAETDLREINVSDDSINTKTGEVQASPTANTVLDRLKTVGTNTTHLGIGGYQPETGSLTTLTKLGDNSDYKVDSRGNMNIRGMVITDEGSFRQEFQGTTLYNTIVGTSCTFTNGSRYVTGVATTFNDATFGYADYVKLSTDTDASYARIESITSATTLTLISAYTGTGGTGTGYMAAYTPLTGAGGSFTVGSSLANIVSGTTTASVTKLFRAIDFCPLIYVVNASISQRIANQTAYIGLSDNIANPTISAFFQFDGTSANTVKCVTQSSVNAADIDTDTITTLAVATNTIQRYRIELNQDSVLFLVNDVLIASHKNHITFPYSYMNGVIGWVNGTSPATTSTIVVDNTYIGNIDIVQVGGPNLDVMRTDMDSIVAKTGEVQASPTANTILDRLKTIGTNTSGVGTNNFTATNSTNLNTIKTNTDFLVTVGSLQGTDLFEYTTSIIRPSNTTAYAVNQAYAATAATAYSFTTAHISQIVQIDEINITNNNTNAPITPTIYLAETAAPVTWADQTIPSTLTMNNVPYMEIIPNTILVKIPGNASNPNVLKVPIVNMNIKMLTDSSAKLYFGVVTSTIFTPISGEYLTITIKGRYI